MSDFCKLSDLSVGDKVKVDGGFTCMSDGDIKEVKIDKNDDLYVDCNDGTHLLVGQTIMNNTDDDTLIGVYKENQ